MKKILIIFASVFMMMTANAQKAYQKSNFFDNTSVGVTVGASTPLDFADLTPFDFNFGIKFQKNLTPVFGLQLEGIAFHNGEREGVTKWINETNVGLNGVINWSNVFCGYKGTPRFFEVSSVTGLGWLYSFDAETNNLTAKTGFDIAFNIGQKRAHSIILTPAVYWCLNPESKIQFNKNYACLAVNLTYAYHFRTSNKTHAFKVYDITALNDEINTLKGDVKNLQDENGMVNWKNEQLQKANDGLKQQVNDLNNENAKLATYKDYVQWTIQFAQGSATLSENAKTELNKVPEGESVNIVGSASPEGSNKRNIALSEQRANAVATYLNNRGVKVKKVDSVGASSNESNRLTIISLSK
jgi:outer membrane protein OmpA-like peptidoglycan-associated protein